MIKEKEKELGFLGITHEGLCIRVNIPGVCPVSAAVLYAISAGQEAAARNARTRTGLQEGQAHTHTHADT